MRILLAFATSVALIITISAMVDGDMGTVAVVGPVLLVVAFLLWRNMRDPETTRAMGLKSKVVFILPDPGKEVTNGTLAYVEPLRKTFGTGWVTTLDRMPEREDEALINRAQRGWVWLDTLNRPDKVKIDYGATWKTWPILESTPAG